MTEEAKLKRRPKGFTPPRDPAHLAEMAELERTNLAISVLYALVFLAPMWIAPVIVGALGRIGAWNIAVPLAILLFVWQGSLFRALENLVHDASHYNWCRENARLNDLVANVLVAAPAMQVVELYRPMHMDHHGKFGSPLDPCMERAINAGKITRGNPLPVRLWAIACIFGELSRDFYRSQLERRSFGPLAFVAWHLLLVAAPYCLMFGIWDGLGLYVLFWLLPFLISLPVVRALAESEEHDYGREGTILQATYTNQGVWGLIVHPAGDAFHAAHHMNMKVPAWKIRRLHELLKRESAEYRATLKE